MHLEPHHCHYHHGHPHHPHTHPHPPYHPIKPPKFVMPHFKPHFKPLYMSDNYNTRQRRSMNLNHSTRRKSLGGPKPHWIPAPARTQQPPESPKRSRFRSRPTFPMCLVCDKRWDEEIFESDCDESEDVEVLTKKFEENTRIIKEKNEEILAKYDQQRAKVVDRLWDMDNGESGERLKKWEAILERNEKDHSVFAPLEPGYRSKRKKDKKKTKKEHDKPAKKKIDKNLTESLNAKEVRKESVKAHIHRRSSSSPKENDDDSTNVSESLDSSPRRTKDKVKTKSKKSTRTSPKKADYFIEVIIDELKKENRELKFSLLSRDEQLTKAAEKIQEMIEENARMAKRLEQALERASQHATDYDDEVEAREDNQRQRIEELVAKVDELERRDLLRQNQGIDEATTVVNALKQQLADCEEEKESLITYIENLKTSYQSVFGPHE